MANVKTTNIALCDSIKLYETHWKYGNNWEDSTVLVDPQYEMIGYYDRGTSNIDIVMCSIPFIGGFIIQDGVPCNCKEKIKYIPLDYKTVYLRERANIDRIKGNIHYQKKLLDKTYDDVDRENISLLISKLEGELSDYYERIKEEVRDYNSNYFIRLRKKYDLEYPKKTSS